MERRQFLGLVGGTLLVGCGGDDKNPAAIDAPEQANCPRTPAETAGPYPGDSVLALAGVLRSDIRSSLGAGTVADGVPLSFTITLVDATDCSPLVGRAVYVWHCDRISDYSLYTGAAQGENYLRGVQETDANGQCTFVSIFPGCYTGRWPHVHFAVYANVDAARNGGARQFVSQFAFPAAACNEVYASPGYEASVAKLAGVSFTGDGVFAGADVQMAATTGSVAAGFASTITVAM